MNLGQAWRILAIARTADVSAIRRAYAERLKALDVDADVAGYAQLRDARDMALRWARQQVAPFANSSDDESPLDAPLASGGPRLRWLYAAPDFAPGAGSEGILQAAVNLEVASSYFDWPERSAGSGELKDVYAPQGEFFVTPTLAVAQNPHDPALVGPLKSHDRALARLLFIDDAEEQLTPLTESETAAAQAYLRAILRDADAGQVSLHDSIEHWLASTLSGAWPRSAPLLADASEAFGWEKQAGKLDESRTIAFLNARLKGLRFRDKVQVPGHQLHQAWAELCRPGSKNLLDNWRAGRSDVSRLIEGVRKNFPELEDYWAPERVASWDTQRANTLEQAGVSGPTMWVWVLGVVAFLRIIAAFSDPSDRDLSGSPPPVEANEIAPATLNKVVSEAFGATISHEKVVLNEAELANTIVSNLRYQSTAEPAERADAAGLRHVLDIVRRRSYAAGLLAGGADLDTAIRLRLAHLRAAKAKNAAACMTFVRTGFLDADIDLPPDIRSQERDFARALLIGGRLEAPTKRDGNSANVPGAIVAQVIKKTGLPISVVRDGMQQKGTDAHQCSVLIALMAATLEYRGSERTALLRTL